MEKWDGNAVNSNCTHVAYIIGYYHRIENAELLFFGSSFLAPSLIIFSLLFCGTPGIV